MAASDFEGSSRRGIRFPAHAVGYMAIEPNLDFVLGADFLDREDIQWLPVAGLIWRPDPDLRLELVFPYPSIDVQLTRWYRLYIGGGLGGGTWAVERDSEVDDLATYGDLRFADRPGTLGHQVPPGNRSKLPISSIATWNSPRRSATTTLTAPS